MRISILRGENNFFKKRFYVFRWDTRIIFFFTLFISFTVLSNYLEKVERKIYGVKNGVHMAGEDFSALLPEEVRSVVEELAIKFQKLPREPAIDKETGEIIPEEDGYIVEIESSIQKVLNANENQILNLDTRKISAKYSHKDLEEANQSLAYYETWFSGSPERYSNICLATKSINNVLLWPGQLFSFNEIVGPRTPERGYLPAPVILMGSSDLDFGGGVCQVSSTVFNAAEQASLEIIERHPHSRAIHYVPKGKDATVDYGYLDLKFSNNRQGPAIIKSGVNGAQVWVQIMGNEED